MRYRKISNSRMAIGVDLGQSQDPTSIAVVERVWESIPDDVVENVRQSGNDDLLREMRKELAPERYLLLGLQQAPLGESYVAQADRLKTLIAREQIATRRPRIWMDYTGVGRPVFDIFQQRGVPRLKPVVITFQGDEGPNGSGADSVPKINLVSRLQALMHTGKLSVPSSDQMPLGKTFRRELMDFRVSYTAVGNMRFGAREGAHDDLILAVALAVYGLKSGWEPRSFPLRL